MASSIGGLRIATMAVGFLVFAWLSLAAPLDGRAEAAVEVGLQRALVTFGVARGLNAVISVAQGTELDVAPAGVGVTLAPGQILDPVNDLIERFSWFMLMSSVALAAERVLIEVSGWLPFSIALTIAVGVVLANAATGAPKLGRHAAWIRQFAIVLMALRFAVPLSAIGSEAVYQRFLAARHAQSEAGLAQARDQVSALNSASDDDPSRGLLSRLKDWGDGVRNRMEHYSQVLEDTVRDTVELIVVFLLQTVVLPLLILALIWALTRGLLRRLPAGAGVPGGEVA